MPPSPPPSHRPAPPAFVSCFVRQLARAALLVLIAGSARAELPTEQGPSARSAAPDFAVHARYETSVVVSLVATGRRPALPAAATGSDDSADDEAAAAPERSLASGIVVDPDGLIMTSAHAVAGMETVIATLADRRQYAARLVGLDVVSDVALLKVDAHGLMAARFGDPSQLAVGDWVAAVGAPFGLERSLTAGIVSAMPRYLPELVGLPLIQTDVAINRGSSGGPLFNLRGEVVGMNALMFSDTGAYVGVSFSLPIDTALAIAGELRTRGRVIRARIGARFQTLTPGLAASFGLSGARGALITRIGAGSSAQAAGLRTGDIVLGLDDRDDMDAAGVQREIARRRPGERIAMNVWRGERVERIVATAEAVPPDALEVAPPPAAHEPPLPRLGLQLRERDAGGAAGLTVSASRGAAERAGILPNDQILAVNEQPVTRIGEFDAALAHRGAGRAPALLVQRGGVRNYVLVQPAP